MGRTARSAASPQAAVLQIPDVRCPRRQSETLGVMTLPYLWILGHLAALIGAAFAFVHLFRRSRAVVVYGVVAGLASCGSLAFILHAIGQSFFGWYAWLAWVVAFFAGYAVGCVLSWTVRLATCGPK